MGERKKNFFWPYPPLQIAYLPDLSFPSPLAGCPEFSTLFSALSPPIAFTHSALRSQLLITTTAVSGLLLNPLNVLSGCFVVLGLTLTPVGCLVQSRRNSRFRSEEVILTRLKDIFINQCRSQGKPHIFCKWEVCVFLWHRNLSFGTWQTPGKCFQHPAICGDVLPAKWLRSYSTGLMGGWGCGGWGNLGSVSTSQSNKKDLESSELNTWMVACTHKHVNNNHKLTKLCIM